MTTRIKLKAIREGAQLPTFGTEQAAGADLRACLADSESVKLEPGSRVLIPCGFAMELPPHSEAQVRPRSGLAIKCGLTVLNAPGTIDADYRGEVCVMLINLGAEDFVVHHGERIAQMVIAHVPPVQYYWTEEDLSETQRADGGFGSTGVA